MPFYDELDDMARDEIQEHIAAARTDADHAQKDAMALESEYNELARLLNDFPDACDSAIVLRMAAIKGAMARVSARKESLDAAIHSCLRRLGA